MWPPRPACSRLALTTMAIAFQRTRLLMRRSNSRSPGYGGSSSLGIVFTYGVLTVEGSFTPASRKRFDSLLKTSGACSVPWFFSTYSRMNSRESSHRWSSPPLRSLTDSACFSGRSDTGVVCCSFVSAFTMLSGRPTDQFDNNPFPTKSKRHEILRPNPAHSARESRVRRSRRWRESHNASFAAVFVAPLPSPSQRGIHFASPHRSLNNHDWIQIHPHPDFGLVF